MSLRPTPGSDPTAARLERAFALLRSHLDDERAQPVIPHVEPSELLDRIDFGLGADPVDDDRLFATLEQVVAATPRTTTRRFFNQLFSGRDDFGTVGELIASFLNSSMYTFKAAGPQVLLERAVTRHMAGKVGLEGGEGVFVPGGSISNLVGMIMARDAHRPASREEGLHAGPPLTLYASRLAHYSIPKNANMLGLGRAAVRAVDVDERGRMRPDALHRAIEADRAEGRDPFLVVATSGTTVLGAFDPLPGVADVAAEHGLWLHVDGALGGSVSLSDRHRHLIEGSERADSFTWNAHKMLGVPLAASVILTRETGRLRASMDEHASYLFQSPDPTYEHGTMSPQCGRRNDALKLWASWKSHGDRGLGARVDRLFGLARHAAGRVKAEPALTLTRDPESVTVCFEVDGRRSDDVCERLRRESRALVGYGDVDGRRVIRLAVVNGALDETDIDAFFDEVLAVAPHGEPGDNALR